MTMPAVRRTPTHTALGAWSGGRHLHFGEPIEEDRLAALLRPGDGIRTVITADAYGAGEADRVVGRALDGVARDDVFLVGAIGHDVYEGEREGPKGFPRFTDPRLRGPEAWGDYVRMAVERSLERCGVDAFDLLLLHNPDRHGYTDERVWDALGSVQADGLTAALGVAPGPANGFTLDVLDCLERFGDRIDWAMLILNPLEPWPGSLVLDACAQRGVDVVARVVDYGGLFWGDVRPGHEFPRFDHRRFRPQGWVEAGLERLDRMRPVADRHGLTPMGLACAWDLAHPAVRVVAPTLIQEGGEGARPIEDKRAELAAVPAASPLSAEEVREIRAIGDNTGSMTLKGATPDHDGEPAPDRWPLEPGLVALGRRWGIEAERDLAHAH
jgi:aryl-alcohol dehydrogenase-like predicted oxidoreductase